MQVPGQAWADCAWGRLRMSPLTAPHHQLVARLDQEVKLPKVFGLRYKRTASDETWVKDLFRAQVIFPPTCATPPAPGTRWLAAIQGRPEHATTFGTAGNGWLPVESIPLTWEFYVVLHTEVLQKRESSRHPAPPALGWQQVEVCAASSAKCC